MEMATNVVVRKARRTPARAPGFATDRAEPSRSSWLGCSRSPRVERASWARVLGGLGNGPRRPWEVDRQRFTCSTTVKMKMFIIY